MNKTCRFVLTMALLCSTLLACGSSKTESSPDGTGGAGGSTGGAGGATATGATGPHGVFEVHYVTGESASASYSEVKGFMYDGIPRELIVWDKKKTDGACSLFIPRSPFCESCPAGQDCVDTNTCQAQPGTHDVGDVTMTGLSGASPLVLTSVPNAAGPRYLSGESLPVPPCSEGTTVSVSATGKGEYPAFSIQTTCIPPLVVSHSSIAIESGKTFTLTWTPSTVSGSRIQVTFDLSHHGGSKGKIICETADTGSLSISGTLLGDLIALGVTGYPRALVTRQITGTTMVGAGQAQLTLYSDRDYVAQIPGLVSCENDSACPTGQTCQPSLMCGKSCVTNADCASGQTCLTSTKICQ